MDDELTQSVLGFQQGRVGLETVRNLVLVEAFDHLCRFRRKGEDEISEFLLEFFDRIEGLLGRFRHQGLPFRHFLLRTLRWQWHTFRTCRSRQRRQARLASETGLGLVDGEVLAEGACVDWDTELSPELSPTSRQRLVLLALRASPNLDQGHLEAVSRETGTDLAWLQACQRRLLAATDGRRGRRAQLSDKRSEAYYRRLMAEDEARREVDPARKEVHEKRATLYRRRLENLTRRQDTLSTSPTHLEIAQLLGMPKGSVDSGLHHLKKALASVYSGAHDHPPRDRQPPQKG